MAKRGQTSTEFIVIIAIIFVILLATISYILGLGDGSTNVYDRYNNYVLTHGDISVVAAYKSDNYATIQLQNNIKENIEITKVTFGTYENNFVVELSPGDKYWSNMTVSEFDGELEIEYKNLKNDKTYIVKKGTIETVFVESEYIG